MSVADDTYLVQLQDPGGAWVDVGLLRRSGNTNWFESLSSYWAQPSRPTLGQVFEDRGPSWAPNAHVGLPRWFSHLLPEGQLRRAVSAASGIKVQRELQILARLGEADLPGAVRVLPVSDEGEVLVPSTEHAVSDGSFESGSPVLKFSLAGLQMKFSVGESARGLTIPLAGHAGNFILKTPDQRPGFDGVPEAEFALMRLAAASGIDTARVSLVDAAEVAGIGRWGEVPGKSLLVERYDRSDGGPRIHAEELAQVMDIATGRNVDTKYRTANFETIGRFVSALSGVHTVLDVIDRIVLNVLAGNGDAHLKNWSFIYPDGVHPQLSPAYDLVPTILFVPEDDLGLNLNRSKDFAEVSPASFRVLGERTGFGGAEAEKAASAAAERIMESWYVLEEVLPKSKRDALRMHQSRLKLL